MTLCVEPLESIPANVVLRAADAEECAKGGMTPHEALEDSRARSLRAYSASWEGEPFMFWGWTPLSLMGDTCAAWMLTTPVADTIPLTMGLFFRHKVLPAILADYPRILVQVDAAHSVAVRWLRRSGFHPIASTGPFLIMSTTSEN